MAKDFDLNEWLSQQNKEFTHEQQLTSINKLIDEIIDVTKNMCIDHGPDSKLVAMIATAYHAAIVEINDIISPTFKDMMIVALNEDDDSTSGITMQ